MTFTSVEQRMAFTYLDRLPPFRHDKSGPPEERQREFYEMLRGLYQLAFDEPLLLVKELHIDDAYPNRFNASSYNKPMLKKQMKKFRDAMDKLLQAMFLLGQGEGGVKIGRTHSAVFERLGIDTANITDVWRWMATRPGADLDSFAYCWFDGSYNYLKDCYARHLGDEAAFSELSRRLEARGYTWHNFSMSLSCVNMRGNQTPPKRGFEYGVMYTGVSMSYDNHAQQPPVIGVCIPGGMKPSLSVFDSMRPELQGFVAQHVKKCNACDYCIQTDKTKSRRRAFIKVGHDGETLALCTYFPGYAFCWSALDMELVENITMLLDFLDGLE